MLSLQALASPRCLHHESASGALGACAACNSMDTVCELPRQPSPQLPARAALQVHACLHQQCPPSGTIDVFEVGLHRCWHGHAWSANHHSTCSRKALARRPWSAWPPASWKRCQSVMWTPGRTLPTTWPLPTRRWRLPPKGAAPSVLACACPLLGQQTPGLATALPCCCTPKCMFSRLPLPNPWKNRGLADAADRTGYKQYLCSSNGMPASVCMLKCVDLQACCLGVIHLNTLARVPSSTCMGSRSRNIRRAGIWRRQGGTTTPRPRATWS